MHERKQGPRIRLELKMFKDQKVGIRLPQFHPLNTYYFIYDYDTLNNQHLNYINVGILCIKLLYTFNKNGFIFSCKIYYIAELALMCGCAQNVQF